MGILLEEARALDERYIMHTYTRSKLFVAGKGQYLWDDEGTRYLDLLAGIAVCPLGHADPVVSRAICAQADKLLQTSNYFYSEHRGEVARELCRLASDEYDWKTFFCNSGAEANECAMKAARRWAIETKGEQAQTIITIQGGFHGRTMETLAATAQDWLQDPFRPLPTGFRSVEPNDCAALEAAMDADVCAILAEPIQGESGVWPLDDSFMHAIRELADAYGCLVIFDEVQTGLYRTGKPLCYQTTQGVVPDIFTLAKGIANGIPCGACVARGQVGEIFKPGMQGSTFGGAQMAMAAARATLGELASRRLDKAASEIGGYLADRLHEVPYVVDVHGKGLMLGASLDETHDAHAIVDGLLDRHIVANACNDRVLRLLPPLIIGKEDVDTLIEALMELAG